MTHDELLEAVKDIPTTRAVVELHKPTEQNLKYIPKLEFTVGCSSCWVAYPCETIQAIEKELR